MMAQALASKTCCTEFNLCEIIFRESQSDSRTVSVMLLACAKHEHVLSSSILSTFCLHAYIDDQAFVMILICVMVPFLLF